MSKSIWRYLSMPMTEPVISTFFSFFSRLGCYLVWIGLECGVEWSGMELLSIAQLDLQLFFLGPHSSQVCIWLPLTLGGLLLVTRDHELKLKRAGWLKCSLWTITVCVEPTRRGTLHVKSSIQLTSVLSGTLSLSLFTNDDDDDVDVDDKPD